MLLVVSIKDRGSDVLLHAFSVDETATVEFSKRLLVISRAVANAAQVLVTLRFALLLSYCHLLVLLANLILNWLNQSWINEVTDPALLEGMLKVGSHPILLIKSVNK